MLLRFWGTRGSIATPGVDTSHFGGNTSCVEVVTKAGQRFVIDCGTGARALGAEWMAHAPKPITATILLSHTHWDHIQGFPFFAPLFVPGNHITVCGPQGAKQTLPEVLAGQMEYTYFPVELGQLGAGIEYRDLAEGTHDINGVRITTQFLNHPAITLGYRIEADGVTVLYLCDHEPFWEGLWRSDAPPGKIDSILHDGDRFHAAFMENADLVIHDAQYTPEEYVTKKNWGHSTYTYVTSIAAAANVKRLLLTHHDPTHNDTFLRDLEARAQQVARDLGSPMQVSLANEGFEEVFEKSAVHARQVNQVYASDPGFGRSLRILIVDDDEDLRIIAKRALTKSGHDVIEAVTGAEALQMVADQRPDLVLLDLFMPAPDGFDVLRTLRSQEQTRTLPVVVLTAAGDEDSARKSFDFGATDFLSKPFTPPQLDARVRSCFAHSARSIGAE